MRTLNWIATEEWTIGKFGGNKYWILIIVPVTHSIMKVQTVLFVPVNVKVGVPGTRSKIIPDTRSIQN